MKPVVITGANRGIGLEFAHHYQAEGWKVTGVCRQSSTELDNIATQVISDIEVTGKKSVELLARELAEKTLIC